MCLLDNGIYLEANIHNVSYKVVDELHAEYHRLNGKRPPSCFAELLEVVC